MVSITVIDTIGRAKQICSYLLCAFKCHAYINNSEEEISTLKVGWKKKTKQAASPFVEMCMRELLNVWGLYSLFVER